MNVISFEFLKGEFEYLGKHSTKFPSRVMVGFEFRVAKLQSTRKP